jgi:hypothetical protein
LGCFPSGSIGAARSLQVMIFVIRFLLFVARPRRSGPFLRSPGSSSSGKGLSEAARSGLKIEEKREKASLLRAAGGRNYARSPPSEVFLKLSREWPEWGMKSSSGRHG